MGGRKEKIAKKQAAEEAIIKSRDAIKKAEQYAAEKTAATENPAVSNMKDTVSKMANGEFNHIINPTSSNKGTAAVPETVTPEVPVETTQTFSDMLAPYREKAKQDKTDAVKMQKYYALTDALGAIGKMGGAAIGGAIGGNALDSAPNVGEYKRSAGYLDAFEKAKQANDRLRDLDDYEFKLNLSKKQRDEERAYNENVANAEREYRKEMILLENELRKAEKAEDRAAEEALKLKILELTQNHEEKLKKMSMEIVEKQMRGKPASDDESTGIATIFDDDRVAYLDKSDIAALMKRYINREYNGKLINEENFDAFISQNPQLVEKYLKTIGKDVKFMSLPNEAPAEDSAPETTKSTYKPNKNKFYGYGIGFIPKNAETSETVEEAVKESDISTEEYNSKFKRK